MNLFLKLILFIFFTLSTISYGQTYFVFTGQTGAANDLDPGEIIRFPFKLSNSLEFGGGSFQQRNKKSQRKGETWDFPENHMQV